MDARTALRRAMVVAVSVMCSIAGLTSAAQATGAAATPVSAGAPVHVRLEANASQSFAIRVARGQTLAAETTLSDGLGYELTGPEGVWSGTIGYSGRPGTDWNGLAGGTYTLELIAGPTGVRFDLTLTPLNVAVAGAQSGAATTQRFTTPRQNVIRTIHAEAGQHIALRVSSARLTGSEGTASKEPAVGVRIAAPTTDPYKADSLGLIQPVTAPAWYFELARAAPVTGDYAILFDPGDDATGSITFTPFVSSDIVRTASLGRSQTMNIATPGQNQVVRFKAGVGYRPVLRVTRTALTSTTTPNDAAPDPGYFLGDSNGTPFEQFHQETLLRSTYLQFAKSGVWTVVIDPKQDDVGHVEYILSLVKDLTYAPEPGAKQNVSITTPGQNAQLAMDLKKGQRLEIRYAAAHWAALPNMLIIGPDLTSIPFAGVNGWLETAPLKITGRYYLSIDPYDDVTGSETFMWYPGPNVVRAITIGTHFVDTTKTRGENDLLTFTGTAGKHFSLRVFDQSWTSVAMDPGTARVKLLDPAGHTFWSVRVPAAPGTLSGPILSKSGRWVLVIDPDIDTVGSITATPYLK